MTSQQILEIIEKERDKLINKLLSEDGAVQNQIKVLDNLTRRIIDEHKKENKILEEIKG